MSKANHKTIISELINIPLIASKDISDDFPSWIRPIIRVTIYLLSLISLILLSPLIIVYRIVRKKRRNAYQKLKKELEEKWYTESSVVALNELRDVFLKIQQNIKKIMIGGFKIEPYGRFHFYQYLQITELLYHWELQHKNYNEAEEICDYVLLESNHENAKDQKPFEGWVVKKSFIINAQRGTIAAQEYLLKHVNHNNKNSPIKNYLYELRTASNK